MPLGKVLEYPKLSYGQLSQGQTLRASLPPGKVFVFTPPLNRNPNEYITAGATAINVNGGVPAANFNIGPDLRGVCDASDFIRGYAQNVLGGKFLADFTDQECRDCARSHLSDPAMSRKEFTSQAGEAYNGDVHWRLEDGSRQKAIIEEELATILAARGHHYRSQYRGIVYTKSITEDFGNTEMLRPAFNSNAEALRICRMSTADDFFWDGYRFRDALVTSYYSGNFNPEKFFAAHIADCVLQRRARTELGAVASARSVLGFGWYGEYQTLEPDVWHVTYRTEAPGGYTLHTRPPRYPMPVQVGLALNDFALLDGVFGWESTLMYGENPAIVSPNFMDTGNAGRYYGSGNPTFAPGVSYYQPGATAGYPPHPVGYQDAPFVASKWVGLAHAYSAWANMGWCRAKLTSSNNYFDAGPAYAIDRFQQHQPYFLCGGNGSKGWLLVHDYTGTYGQIREWDVQTPIGTWTVKQASGTSRLHLL